MTRRQFRALVMIATTAVVLGSSALPATAGRRPPPSDDYCTTEFDGRFVGTRPSERGSFIALCPGDSNLLVVVWGLAPATCRETAEFGGKLVGPERGVDVQFSTRPLALIRLDGSFAFTARSPHRPNPDFPNTTVRVRGTFDGTTVVGRVTFTTGPWWRYARCTAEGRFRASVKRP